jgi:hypothetical protein
VTAALALFLLTVFHVLTGAPGLPLGLLSQYFYGYGVSWPGALVGAAAHAACGFAGGWLLGVTHNLTKAAWMFAVRMRTELSQQRNFIDHLR